MTTSSTTMPHIPPHIHKIVTQVIASLTNVDQRSTLDPNILKTKPKGVFIFIMASIQNMSDTEFLAFLNAFIATVSGDLASYPGVTAPMMADLGTMRDDFADKLLSHNQAQDAAKAATVAKNISRTPPTDKVLNIRDLTKANGVSEDKYTALGFPASPAAESLPPLATVPVGTVDTRNRLQHTLHFADAATPNIKRKPRGTVGCEIFVKIDGPPPGNETECVFLALDTATPYVAEYPPEHAGKTAHYLLRWLMKDGSRTACGETISATITG